MGLTYVNGTCVEMLQNRTIRRNNTSGVPGVDWLAKKQRWRATICFKGKRRYLGSYKNFEDAVKARKRAEEELFDAFLDIYFRKMLQSELRAAEELCTPIARDRRQDPSNRLLRQQKVLKTAEDSEFDAVSAAEHAPESNENGELTSPKELSGFVPGSL